MFFIKDENLENLINTWEKEITPLPIFSPEVKLIQINYTEEETKLMDIFRAVLNSKEVSLRVYELTSMVISYFPTDYGAWVLRRECLDKIKEINPLEELNWLDHMIEINQKNYQIWHHRKLLIEKLNDVSHEKNILEKIFQTEPKNFHAWTHRIWMIRRFNNTEGEFDFIEKMLKDDVKNNSVWNYRFFLVQYLNNGKFDKNDKNIVEKEIKYALVKIKECPVNECPYSYIRGFITKYNFKYSDFSFIKEFLESELKENLENNPYALNLLLDYYEEEKNKDEFNKIADKLKNVDYIRKKYYGWRKDNSLLNEKKENDANNKSQNK